jgi:DNA invertase Pin-like site-specific DNA recombinase
VSSVSAGRPKLEEALRFVREGDVLIATKPDRLARSTRQLLDLVEDLDRRKVSLILLSMGGERIDSRSPTGKLMLTVLGAMAEFERNMMLERQREGIAKAKAEGKYASRQRGRSRQTSCEWRRRGRPANALPWSSRYRWRRFTASWLPVRQLPNPEPVRRSGPARWDCPATARSRQPDHDAMGTGHSRA